MPREHISDEVMRTYLLGQLPEDQADAVESEYFADRTAFVRIRSAETRLIMEYLEDSLSASDKRQFESRYLRVPEMRRRVEEVKRATQPSATRPWFKPIWRPVLASAVVIFMGVGIWLYQARLKANDAGGQRPKAANHDPGKPLPPTVATVLISPGLAKGPDSKPVQFVQPAPGATINVLLELPGQLTAVRPSVRIATVKPDGRQEPIWNSAGVLSEPRTGAQALRVQLAGPLLAPGDYVIEAATTDGVIRETYVYRVTRPR